jgi:hypothetical protein
MGDLGDLQRALATHGLTTDPHRVGRQPDGQVRLPGPLAQQAARLLRAAQLVDETDWAARLDQDHQAEVTVEPIGAVLLARELKRAAEQLDGGDAAAAQELAANLERAYAGEEDRAPALAALAAILLARGNDLAAVERALATVGNQAWLPLAAALGMLEEAASRHRARPTLAAAGSEEAPDALGDRAAGPRQLPAS